MGRERLKHKTRRDVMDLLRKLPAMPAAPPSGTKWDTVANRLLFTQLLRNTSDMGSGAAGLGEIELPHVDHAAFTTDQDDYDLGTGAIHKIHPGVVGLSLTGVVAARRGAVRILINDEPNAVTLKNDITSQSVNRFICPYARNLVMPGGDTNTAASLVGLYHQGAKWLVFPLTFSPGIWVGTDNGALWVYGQNSELITIAAATTSDSVGTLLPSNSIIEAVVVRVTVAIPTATTFDVGAATIGQATRFSTAVPVAVNTTAIGLNHMKGSVSTDALGPVQLTGVSVRITPNATPANNNGRVRVTVFYRSFTPPTS